MLIREHLEPTKEGIQKTIKYLDSYTGFQDLQEWQSKLEKLIALANISNLDKPPLYEYLTTESRIDFCLWYLDFALKNVYFGAIQRFDQSQKNQENLDKLGVELKDSIFKDLFQDEKAGFDCIVQNGERLLCALPPKKPEEKPTGLQRFSRAAKEFFT